MITILHAARGLLSLLVCAPLLLGAPAQPTLRRRTKAEAMAQAATPAPSPETGQTPSAPEAPPNTYTLDIHRQDAETVLWEFAKRAKKSLTILDRPPTLITVTFINLPFDRALKEIVRAADLEYVKNEDGYTVGLPIDLKLRFPNPEDKDTAIEATYRCRRIDAASLVETIRPLFPEGDGFMVTPGPQFLTPEVESSGGLSDKNGPRTLKAAEKFNRTHDVVFSGKLGQVLRALTLARKLDRPRKQVRVNIRVVQMTTNASRNLGVAWMQSLSLTANEQGSVDTSQATSISSGNSNSNAATPQGQGLTLGRFTHSVVSLNATLNALEQTGESKTVANPTLLVLDGEKSFILSGTEYILPKLDKWDSLNQPIYSTETTRLGLYMQVGVQVGLDDDMVLTIYPQVTSLSGFTTVNTIPYPIINTIEEQATVRAIKGDVIVLGGIKRDSTTDAKSGIPFLGNLPFLGKLFSSDAKSKSTEELMFFLTPEIVEDTEQPLEMHLTVNPAAPPPAS
jgi:type IV pilus assembly protein PilQ